MCRLTIIMRNSKRSRPPTIKETIKRCGDPKCPWPLWTSERILAHCRSTDELQANTFAQHANPDVWGRSGKPFGLVDVQTLRACMERA